MGRVQDLAFYRGLKANLPALNEGEPGWTTDTRELYVGSSGGTNYQVALTGSAAIANDPAGFPNRTDSVVTFTNSTPDRTLQIAPAVTSFSFWVLGVEYTKSSAETIQITDTEGIWFFYYDDSGTLMTTQTFDVDIILKYAIVAVVYWDAANNDHRLYEERHGVQMSGATHLYAHNAFGAQYNSGLGLGDIVADGTGNNNTDAQFSLEAGVIADEDIRLSISGRTAPASTRMYYKSGAAGDWRWDTATSYPLKTDGGTGRAAFNLFSGGVWSQSAVSNNAYTLTHVFATNDSGDDIAVIQGEAQYGSLASAQQAALTEIAEIRTAGLPSPEFVPLATFIWQTSNAYGNAVKSRIRSTADGADYVDHRGQNIPAGTGGGIEGVFGNDYQDAESSAQSTTTSTSYQTKVSLVTPTLSGTYRLGWSAIMDSDTVDVPLDVQLYDNTGTVELAFQQVEAPSTTNRVPVGGSISVTLTGTETTYQINYRAGDASGQTVGIRNARLELWRVT